MMRSASRRTPSLLPNYIVLIALFLFAAGPLVILGFTSLKSTEEIGANPLGPPIERVERAYGFPIPRARIEELLPSGAATLRTAAGDAGRPAAPDSTREPLLRSTLDEIRRAAELDLLSRTRDRRPTA